MLCGCIVTKLKNTFNSLVYEFTAKAGEGGIVSRCRCNIFTIGPESTNLATAVKAILLGVLLSSIPASNAYADSGCKGLLGSALQAGFKKFFDPEYSPSLSHIGGRVIPENFAKKMGLQEAQTLLSKPTVRSVAVLSPQRAEILKNWMVGLSNESVPA